MANVLEVFLSGDSKELEAALSRADKQLKNFGKSASDIGKTLSLSITAPLALAGTAAINFAKDFNESLNKVDVAFKESAGEVQAFAKTTLRAFGIAEGSALDMAANFGDMATSMGLSTKQAADMSKQLVGLAGDLASFKNISIDVANTALTGIFTGETESLKRLGIVMTEQNVEMWAFQNGIKKAFSEMSQAEKTMTRFKYIMDMTTNAQGDFERTGGGVANQMRILGEGLKQVGNEFGQVMLPVVNKVVKAMNSFITSLSATSTETKTVIVVLGALAAAIGPVLIGIGLVSSNIVSGFAVASKAVKGLWAAMAANPILAITTLVAGLTAAYLIQEGVFTKMTNVQGELNKLKKDSINSTAKEESELRRLSGIAQNHAVALDERKKAIKAINLMSPEYLKGITLETIGTDSAKKSIDNYIGSLQKKSLLMAANSKIEELMAKKLALQTGEADAGTTAFGALNDMIAKLGASRGLYSSEIISGAKERAKVNAQEIKNIDELIKKTADLAGIDLNKVEPVEKAKKPTKTYDPEAAKAALKEEQRIQAERTKAGEDARDAYEKILGDINRENVNAAEETATMYLSQKDREYMILEENFAAQIALRERFGQSTVAITDKYRIEKKALEDKWNQIELENITAQGDEVQATLDSQDERRLKNLQYYQEQIAQSYATLRDATASIFTDIGNSILSAFGPATSILEQVGLAIAKVMVQMGAMAIAEKLFGAQAIKSKQAQATADSIKVGTAAAAAAGPAGLALLAPFIASAVAMTTGAFAAVPKFAAGGIVSGPTMGLMGEYPGAKSNPEVIAPLNKLQSMMDTGSGGNMNLSGEFVVRGQDLVLALQRAEKQKSRIG
jgi:hypothetical protein